MPASAAPSQTQDERVAQNVVVDVHTHIDKGHIWHRAQNPDGTHLGARNAVMADRSANWSREDVRKRMDFALRCAFAHGTGALPPGVEGGLDAQTVYRD